MGKPRGNKVAHYGELEFISQYIKQNPKRYKRHYRSEEEIKEFINEERRKLRLKEDYTGICCDHLLILNTKEVILIESKPQPSQKAKYQLKRTADHLIEIGYEIKEKIGIYTKSTFEGKHRNFLKDYGYHSKLKKELKVYIIPKE